MCISSYLYRLHERNRIRFDTQNSPINTYEINHEILIDSDYNDSPHRHCWFAFVFFNFSSEKTYDWWYRHTQSIMHSSRWISNGFIQRSGSTFIIEADASDTNTKHKKTSSTRIPRRWLSTGISKMVHGFTSIWRTSYIKTIANTQIKVMVHRIRKILVFTWQFSNISLYLVDLFRTKNKHLLYR